MLRTNVGKHQTESVNLLLPGVNWKRQTRACLPSKSKIKTLRKIGKMTHSRQTQTCSFPLMTSEFAFLPFEEKTNVVLNPSINVFFYETRDLMEKSKLISNLYSRDTHKLKATSGFHCLEFC